MAKSPNHYVSRVIKPFAVTFYRANGRLPKTSEVMDAFQGQLQSKNMDAVRKALKRMEVAGPEKFAPAMKGIPEKFAPPPEKVPTRPPTLQGRLSAVRAQLDTLDSQADDGVVDAHSYDKLTRLARQIELWIKVDAEDAERHGVSEIAPPAMEAILDRYRKRKKQGLSTGGPRDKDQSHPF